jgi:hypothetical protein
MQSKLEAMEAKYEEKLRKMEEKQRVLDILAEHPEIIQMLKEKMKGSD